MRRLARMIQEQLSSATGAWTPLGWRPTWVSPGWKTPDRLQVEIRKPHGQVILELPVDLELPDDLLVRQGVARLAQARREDWTVRGENDWRVLPS